MKADFSGLLRRLSEGQQRLAAAWRHPFDAEKRRAYRNDRAAERQSAHEAVADRRPGATRLRHLLTSSRSLEKQARLYECYVDNAQGKFSRTDYVEETRAPLKRDKTDTKLIAYYLPQFHPIEENDRWWGKGFTEWRNVARAFPSFETHYQPRVPGELGYYDLRVPDVMRRQVELAKQYGISAFCFHFYWFGGKRLLELPLLNYLADKDLDLPFCLCWANENWSRAWDGRDQDLLVAQNHGAEDDLALVRYLDKYFKDSRYLKIDGRPVLTVYRPALLPDPSATVARWREAARSMGYPGLYVIATNSFAFTDFRGGGFDALSEFPPHGVEAPDIARYVEVSKFRTGGDIRYYPTLVAHELSKPGVSGIHPGVMPSWDNSARRPTKGTIYQGATPELFHDWLTHALARAAANPAQERMVFINAWNEWAEGAYLEPDARYGYAWLQAVADALNASASAQAASVSVVVPNYNYGRYLAERLTSIAAQTVPVLEVIVLDDASTDTSRDVIASLLSTCEIPSRFVANEVNSGSAFRQWQRGVEMARGDYVWIAEADDLAEPNFLAEVLPAFGDPDVVMSFCQSQQIDEAGRVICKDYLDYVSDIHESRWKRKFTASGEEEIAAGLAVKNTIPNISGALFRREALASVLSDNLEQIASLRHAGDWMAYVRLLERGSIAFSPKALNKHRRHRNSITTGDVNRRHVEEIAQVQDFVITRFRLGPEVRAQAADYVQRLQKQFGLTDIAKTA